MTKHSILKKTSEGLVIDLYFSDRPEMDSYAKEIWHKEDLVYWFSHPDKIVKVDEGSKKQLLNYAVKLGHWDMKDFHAALQQGIEISPDVFEVRRCYEKSTHPELKELAFFKEEKEETQDDLWDEIYRNCPISLLKHQAWVNEIKQNFEIKRRKG